MPVNPMSGETIIRHCSPTLAGLKTGSLFGSVFESREAMYREIRGLNRILGGKGLRVMPLQWNAETHRALIYMYRPSRLEADFQDHTCGDLLRDAGYTGKSCNRCIARLIRRLQECEEFPHEIGLFLGYPPEDVSGFIRYGSRACKCVGYWKVYGDEQKALRIFARYKKCTDLYLRQLRCGKSIEQLAVAG